MGQPKRLYGPAYLANSNTNIYQGGGGSALIYDVVKHVHFFNTSNSDVTITVYLGATGASAGGTEQFKTFTIKANQGYDWLTSMKMTSADFLVGSCSAASAVTVTINGEQTVV